MTQALGRVPLDLADVDLIVSSTHKWILATHGGGLVGVPQRGYWNEVLNTNSLYYGGTGFGNHGGRQSTTALADGYEQSLSLTLPGLSTLVFKWTAKE